MLHDWVVNQNTLINGEYFVYLDVVNLKYNVYRHDYEDGHYHLGEFSVLFDAIQYVEDIIDGEY